MRYNTKVEIFEWSGEMTVRYLDSGVIKNISVKYEIWDNGCDLLDPRDNRGTSGFYEEIVNILGGTNVWSKVWIEILKGLHDRCVLGVKCI